MNLHAIVSGAIGAINPQVAVTLTINAGGYTTNADGSRTPNVAAPASATAQSQPMQYNDIVQADSFNIQGVRRKVYLSGEIDGLVRADNKGGDLITYPDGSVWKVAFITEQWPDWCAAVITLQNGS